MYWPEYVHHLTLHFPIVGSLFLAVIGVWWVKTADENLAKIVRWGGWFIFLFTTTAMVSGIIAAPGFFGGEGPQGLSDHRNMGVTVWCAAAVATLGFEIGTRVSNEYLRRFAALCWCAAAVGVIGAGHWGGSALHSDKIPWQQTTPILEDLGESDAE